jgi:outer membrane protein assembly factor BamB
MYRVIAKGTSGRLYVSYLWIAFLCQTISAQISVLTQHNDNSRSGINLNEAVLTTSNVNVSTFGKIFSAKVDGYIFAQPLYVPNLTIAGGTHNVVYVATAADSVFAFDANTGALLWNQNYGTPVPSSVINSQDILVQVGIISTPAIDLSTGTMYVVTKTYENNTQIFRLHALDITTGGERFGGPVQISGTVNGSGDGNDGNGHVPFQASKENQRPAVTLANGMVYLAFASHGDIRPYHGWVLAYSASTLQQLYVFNDTANGSDGGIWQSGQGLVVDATGNLYFMVGNGTADVQQGGSGYGEGFVKLSSTLVPLDYFIPNDFDGLNSRDADVSSGGPIPITGTPYIAGEGKEGLIYVVDTTNMGHYNASSNQIHQEFTAGPGLFGAPIFWNNPSSPTLYVWNKADTLKAFQFSNALFTTTPSAQSSVTQTGGIVGGAALTLSSNGNAPGTNILWASIPLHDANQTLVEGQLFAFDATNISTELWDTRQNDARDDLGNWAKFVAPTVANGKVYMATDSGQLVAYGLLPPSSSPAVFRPSDGTWYIQTISGAMLTQPWGQAGDVPVTGDYDGDDDPDYAVWRPSNAVWYVLSGGNRGVSMIQQWGLPGDVPVPGDYDGDGKTDFAVWRPAEGNWYILPSSNMTVPVVQHWGAPGDVPVPGDYDDDGRTDLAIWRPAEGNWYILPSSNTTVPIVQQWGTAGDVPLTGDFDGDKKADLAIWRPANAVWYIIPSANPSAPIIQQWGLPGDIPMSADYDGDGKNDFAIWRPSDGTWRIIPSTNPNNRVIQWGLPGDVPVSKPPQ